VWGPGSVTSRRPVTNFKHRQLNSDFMKLGWSYVASLSHPHLEERCETAGLVWESSAPPVHRCNHLCRYVAEERYETGECLSNQLYSFLNECSLLCRFVVGHRVTVTNSGSASVKPSVFLVLRPIGPAGGPVNQIDVSKNGSGRSRSAHH
jgi:hypothetical protein